MKNKTYHGERTAHRYVGTPLLMKPHKHWLIDVTWFRFSSTLYSPSVLLRHTNNFSSVSTNLLNRRIYETKFPTHGGVLYFPFSVSRITLNFPSTLITFLWSSLQPCYHSTSLVFSIGVENWKTNLGRKWIAVGIFALWNFTFWDNLLVPSAVVNESKKCQ
jgi:hypothetical protein